MSVWDTILDLIYVPQCPGCGKAVRERGEWCQSCVTAVWDPRFLDRSCGNHLDGCYALGDYRGPLRKALGDLKFRRKTSSACSFAGLLDRFPWWEDLSDCSLAVPVPLSKERYKKRGYNQTDLIFRKYIRSIGKTYDDLLVRIRNTPSQSGLSRTDREKNIRGVFHIRRGADVSGQHILLLDDVFTTGATMETAAKELKRAGADQVTGLVIASGRS